MTKARKIYWLWMAMFFAIGFCVTQIITHTSCN